MELKVTWTKRAKKNYTKILDYIVNEFGNNSGKNYHERVEKLIDLLKSFPELGTKQSKLNNLYGIILYRRTTIFFTRLKKNIRIINVVDNRWKK
ncbi:MAG: type II toxin-antitoxin system RelE/ParE family toxin [Cyclobacteriaceae bacterium]|nr:type II toxin-antitoxin system RelE/ParE family toxin [Cyclobacteriaceae bacterium]